MYLNDEGIYLTDGPFDSDKVILDLNQSKGSHWVANINDNYFDSYECVPPQKLSKFIIKRNGYCLYSQYKKYGLTTEKDVCCASYCLYIIYLTKVEGIDFRSAVLNLYYQKIQ